MPNDPSIQPYMPETAAEFYSDLLHCASLSPDFNAVYVQLHRVFQHLLAEHTTFTRVSLVGTFAKTDYLLKEGHARQSLRRRVNDLRVRLHQFQQAELEKAEMQRCWTTDLQVLCQFVEFLYDSPVPAGLIGLFPERRRSLRKSQHLGDCLRMLVERWDGMFLYGPSEQEGIHELKVCYADGNRSYPYDWSYLTALLTEGAQLHLIRPRLEDGVVYPELIVLEPDYLVDISQISKCMENYADSPLVYLLHQIEPAPQSEALVLGNLAGQMLDEELHYGEQELSYAETVSSFFRHNALALLTTPPGSEFHSNAQAQRQHIRQAIRETLPERVGSFSRHQVMVEPSFFSSMLGLQGRMDFLQLDQRLVIEQKSGSGAYVPYDPDPSTPKPQEQHYVQLLLYMTLLRYNYREQYEQNNQELQAFLLYSKYPNSLLGLGFAPELIFTAFKLRNQLVWHQYRLAEGGFKVLGTLTPDRLNQKQVHNSLWERFQLPQIQALLAPIREASDLEQAYYYRMLQFVAREHMLSKLGNQTKENSGFSSIWLDSLEDKLAAGNIYHRLQLVSPSANQQGKVEQVVLRFHDGAANDMSNFRPGDIVILYSYENESIPNACSNMVHRCSISDIAPEQITLHLRHAQVDAHVFTRHIVRCWAIEHDFYESSYSSLYRGLHAFLSTSKERRDLLLLQRHPLVDNTLALKGDYGMFNVLSLRVRQARELFLIIGPPGTGKTSFGMFNTLQEELLHEGTNVIIISYTNRAVDEICSKLHGIIDFIRLGNRLACAPQYRDYLLDRKMRSCANVAALAELLQQTRVVVSTVTALTGSLSLLQHKQFSLCIIDEASQILEPHLMGILSATYAGRPAITRFVMIGDHKQLPAVVQQREEESAIEEGSLLHDIGLHNCRLSLFERLLSRYIDDPSVTYMLTRQGRMHPNIADFPNRMFYDGKLQTVPLPHQLQDSPEQRVVFLPSTLPVNSPSDKTNTVEAAMVAELVKKIYQREGDQFKPDETVGVIVPYRNQIATIRTALDTFGIPALHDITIDTVERYQGSQRRYIIYGFTIQKHYQLKFLCNNTFVENGKLIDRKLNVAMTRAQEYLYIIGNPELLKLNPLFTQLLDYTPLHSAKARREG